MELVSSVRRVESIKYIQKGPIDIETYVVKQLASCDPILRRHRKQALRVTCLYIAANYLWVGTTAGVILNIGEAIGSHLNFKF